MFAAARVKGVAIYFIRARFSSSAGNRKGGVDSYNRSNGVHTDNKGCRRRTDLREAGYYIISSIVLYCIMSCHLILRRCSAEADMLSARASSSRRAISLSISCQAPLLFFGSLLPMQYVYVHVYVYVYVYVCVFVCVYVCV